ncbi:hypothetical protein Nepgr_029944 [Nepenthes gracilis]|uniref:TH1 domain-containing protein n=1 Tax=Nepenthes gracilis TaxID=150966 RepID=A0AAD3TFW3_NEPGR|nr:hypothetical protein Nepgr_029944 [Nepenthes gracilis]
MDYRYRFNRRVQNDEVQKPQYDAVEDSPESYSQDDDGEGRQPSNNASDHQEDLVHRDYRGDYLDVPSQPHLMKILNKQGDRQILFADKVLKFTGSGKIKRRTLVITEFAIYIVDPETDALKRRIALAAVERVYLSELNDNFVAIIIPTEYDLLMASTRKNEIATKLVEATKSSPDYEVEVVFSNRFEYNASADLVKSVQFEEVEGGVRTRILNKEGN